MPYLIRKIDDRPKTARAAALASGDAPATSFLRSSSRLDQPRAETARVRRPIYMDPLPQPVLANMSQLLLLPTRDQHPLLLEREDRPPEPSPPPYGSVRGRITPRQALLNARPVQNAAPAWYHPTQPVVTATDRFDLRHRKLVGRGAKVITRLQRDPTSARMQEALEKSIDEMRFNRLYVEEALQGTRTYQRIERIRVRRATRERAER